jgi:hypothetical protein
MEQMQALYKQHGKLSPSLVYNQQYGSKSAALSAFAELEKSAFVGALLRSVGGGLARSAAGAQKAHKVGFQNFYKGMSNTARNARPELKQRAWQYQSSSPAELGKIYNIGQRRQNLGSKLQAAGDDLGLMRYTNPNMARAVDATALTGLTGAGATTGYLASRPGAPFDKEASMLGNLARSGGKRLSDWSGKAIKSHKAKALQALAGPEGAGIIRQTGKGSRELNKGLKARQQSHADIKGTTDVAYGKTNEIGQTRKAYGSKLKSVGKKIDRFAQDHQNLYRSGMVGVPTVGGAGLLYGSNRMGYGSGREVGADEGYEAGSAAALQAMGQNNPGYFGNLFNAVVGQDPGNAAAVQSILDQNKSDIIKAILSGRS